MEKSKLEMLCENCKYHYYACIECSDSTGKNRFKLNTPIYLDTPITITEIEKIKENAKKKAQITLITKGLIITNVNLSFIFQVKPNYENSNPNKELYSKN